MAGMLSVFAEFERINLKERIKAGISHAQSKGSPHGRPRAAARHEAKIKRLFSEGMNKSEIARKLKIGRTSVIRILADKPLPKRKIHRQLTNWRNELLLLVAKIGCLTFGHVSIILEI